MTMKCLDEIYRYFKKIGVLDANANFKIESNVLRIHGPQVLLDFFAPLEFLSVPPQSRDKLIKRLAYLQGLGSTEEFDKEEMHVFIAKDKDVYAFYLERKDRWHVFLHLFYPDDNISINTKTDKLVKIKKIRRTHGL